MILAGVLGGLVTFAALLVPGVRAIEGRAERPEATAETLAV
jgi:hypothetical protein